MDDNHVIRCPYVPDTIAVPCTSLASCLFEGLRKHPSSVAMVGAFLVSVISYRLLGFVL